MTGEELKKAREHLGLSQLGLAVIATMSPRQIQDFEAGKSALPQGLEGPLQRAIAAAMSAFWADVNRRTADAAESEPSHVRMRGEVSLASLAEKFSQHF